MGTACPGTNDIHDPTKAKARQLAIPCIIVEKKLRETRSYPAMIPKTRDDIC